MNPNDMVEVRAHLANCDDESAARVFCRLCGLNSDAERLLIEILWEAREDAEWRVREEYERAAMEDGEGEP